MCGIVGYVGDIDARKIVLDGLKLLEYRGYDSSGIALVKDKEIMIYKDKGRVDHLSSLVDYSFLSHLGIGHTRWATHGIPSKDNAHPHRSSSGRFVIVHNGVIDNYQQIKINELCSYHFSSDTDSEVIANLIEYYVSKGKEVKDALHLLFSVLEGSYSLLVIDTKDNDRIYFVKNKTPLLVGKGKHGYMIASDTLPFVNYCDSYLYLEDKTYGYIENNKLEINDVTGTSIKYKLLPLNIDSSFFSKGEYKHYMLKEIDEQPGVIRNLILKYFNADNTINIDEDIIKNIKESDHLYICACGTSLHAGMVGKYYFENLCSIETTCLIASECIYNMPLLSKKPFFIFVSQSGETADVISVIKKCKEREIRTLALTNTCLSSVDRLCDYSLLLHAGKEIAVASTKAYTAQVVLFSILVLGVSKRKTNLKNNLNSLALAIENIFTKKDLIKNIANRFKETRNAFYIGRGLDYYSSLESALKLKEIAYIHVEAFASGELKHGSIALIEKDTPVIALCTNENTNAITRSNLMETKARGALGIVISTKSCSLLDDDIIIDDVASYLTPVISVVVSQLIAYYSALERNLDVDKPRNLAKSVTVE